MRFRYSWTERDWREAVTLASQRKRSGTPLNGMTYVILLVPMIGAMGDVIAEVRQSGQFTRQSAIVPLLLVSCSVISVVLLYLTRLRAQRRMQAKFAMPTLEHEAILQESGWLVADAGATAPLQPWSDVLASRRGASVVVLLRNDGFDAIPTRTLTAEQAGHLKRLITRKLRPAA